ncbi:Putative amidase domain-containing protein [Acetitomaculum ruminis DSM 5522]|uniref:Putative amidase domain-containing protein n=1 Tax=Acetitomaculum ruminis DSM 5522 TaxID=1120918 RepID=A0A1I0VX26_9FIRM|nr:amidase domain-containing protein [Acetitomaculum ruminis]SFA80443.1 Putative amidase domain-containing protein [Acetitomaculum ruminis DSM 5522]
MIKLNFKNSKRIFVMILGFILTFMFYLPVAAASGQTNNVIDTKEKSNSFGYLRDIHSFKNYNRLTDFLNSYMDFICSSKGNLSIDDKEAEKYYEKDKSVEYIYLDYTIKRRLAQIDDLSYKITNHSVDIKSVEEKNDLYYVSLEDYTKMKYGCVKNQESEELVYHYIILKSQKESFKIVVDNDYDELREELGITDNSTVEQVSKKVDDALKKEKKEITREEQSIKRNYLNSDNNNISDDEDIEIIGGGEVPCVGAASFSYHKYNRNAAYQYAFKYYRNPNPAYVNFEQMGGNCTNFTSQCLKAGGIVQDNVGNYTWYYNNANNRAGAWSSAELFRQYFRNNVGSHDIKGLRAGGCRLSTTRLGDLVQRVKNGKATHTMFICGCVNNIGTNGDWIQKTDVLIAQNSTGVSGRLWNVPLKTKYSGKQVKYIHIVGSFY